MRVSTLRSSALTLLCLAVSTPVAAQTLQGRALDAGSGAGVPEATVTALGPKERPVARVRTGPDGTFTLELPSPGTYRLRGERVGYQVTLSDTFSVGVRETLEVALNLSAAPLTIEPLTVTARREPPRLRALELNGFYAREAAGFGKFLRREDIRRHPKRNMAQVFDRIPGARLHVDKQGRQYIFFDRAQVMGAVTRSQGGAPPVCLPKLYLDGMPVVYQYGVSDINSVGIPESVEAVEIYRSPAGLPQEFNRDAACGVIVIWTRATQ